MNILGDTESFCIHDVRSSDAFKTSSFTGFKKIEVKNQILQCLLHGKVENICYWTAEMVAAGHFVELWDLCLFFLGKHIHLGNPLLVMYIQKQMDMFRVIANDTMYKQDPLPLRNNPKIREMMAEIFCTMALSDKKHSYEELKIQEIADVSHIVHHLRADHSQYAETVLRLKDPKEWSIAINELGYHISNEQSFNMNLACFWLEWMISFDAMCRKRKQPLLCQQRSDYTDIDSKFRGDFIWVIWECLVHYAQERGELEHILIKTLFQLFRVRYSYPTVKKRKPLLYFAISILTETQGNAHLKKEILNENAKQMVAVAVQQVHQIIYKSLKQYEILAETREPTNNTKLAQSMEKMRLLRENDLIDL